MGQDFLDIQKCLKGKASIINNLTINNLDIPDEGGKVISALLLNLKHFWCEGCLPFFLNKNVIIFNSIDTKII